MKKLVLVLAVIFACSLSIFGQKTTKLAHVDVQGIFGLMPEKATATKEMEDYAKVLEDQMMVMYKEYETKMSEYQQNKDSWSQLIRQDKEEEITSLQSRIQNFQQQAQVDMQNRENTLLEPINNKIHDAINAVAKEQGITYVYDVAMLLYVDPDALDITQAVKTKLGIK
ncbi:MAG: OmpH family outer membrane protein [Bacteroidales bacterium]|nr:OmpH family outer membrane protein [Bacteroidales bacterium]